MILHRATRVDAPLDDVWEFFSTPRNLQMLTPPWLSFRIISLPDRDLEAGDELEYRIRIAGVPRTWRSLVTIWKPPFVFADFQKQGPYEIWNHRHLFIPVDGGTEIVDLVHYELPFGKVGAIVGGALVRAQLKMIFRYRRSRIREMFGGRNG